MLKNMNNLPTLQPISCEMLDIPCKELCSCRKLYFACESLTEGPNVDTTSLPLESYLGACHILEGLAAVRIFSMTCGIYDLWLYPRQSVGVFAFVRLLSMT